jgi:hypothetical protein
MNFSDIVTFSRSSAAWERRSDGKYYSVGTNVARQADYWWNGSALEKAGLLIEGSRQNLVLQSHRVDGNSPWTKFGSPVFDSTGLVALFSGKTPYKFTNDNAGSGRFVDQALVTTYGANPVCGYAILENVNATESLVSLARPGGSSIAYVSYNWATGVATGYNGSVGTLVASGAIVLSNVGLNGGKVVLLWVSGTATTGTDTIRAIFYPVGSAQNALSCIVHDTQVESASFPSSPILTDAAAVTRSADVATVSAAGWFADGQAGSLLCEYLLPYSALLGGSYDQNVWLAWDGTTNKTISLRRDRTNGKVYGYVVDTTQQAAITTAAIVNAGTYKSAIAWAPNDFVFYQGGTQVGTDGSGTIPTGITTLQLGGRSGVDAGIYGYLRNVRYWPRRLATAELQALTT